MEKENSKILIALEGIDGVGKTTLGRKLENQLKAVFIPSPLPSYSQIRKFYESSEISYISRFYFYLGALWDVWLKIMNNSNSNIFIIDRYILSTKLYHNCLFRNNNLEEYLYLIDGSKYPKEADLNIILTADEITRINRLKNKTHAFDYEIEHKSDIQNQIQLEFLKRDGLKLDTSGNDIESISNQCYSVIDKMFKKI